MNAFVLQAAPPIRPPAAHPVRPSPAPTGQLTRRPSSSLCETHARWGNQAATCCQRLSAPLLCSNLPCQFAATWMGNLRSQAAMQERLSSGSPGRLAALGAAGKSPQRACAACATCIALAGSPLDESLQPCCRCCASTASGTTAWPCMGTATPTACTTSWRMTLWRFWRCMRATVGATPFPSS